MCKQAWDTVSSVTITNCFKKAGFIHNIPHLEKENNSFEIDKLNFIDDIYSQVEKNISFEDFASVDDNLAICGEQTDEDIINEVIDLNKDQEENSDDDFEEPIPSSSEAYQSLKLLRSFFESQEDTDKNLFKCINLLEEQVVLKKIKNIKQTSIKNYFKKL